MGSRAHIVTDFYKWTYLKKRMNRLLKNSKSNYTSGFSGLFSPVLGSAPSWALSSLSSMGEPCLTLSVLIQGWRLCFPPTHLPDSACQLRHWRLPLKKSDAGDFLVEEILFYLGLSLCPSNSTFCHKNEFPSWKSSKVCLLARTVTSKLPPLVFKEEIFPSYWQKGANCIFYECLWH